MDGAFIASSAGVGSLKSSLPLLWSCYSGSQELLTATYALY